MYAASLRTSDGQAARVSRRPAEVKAAARPSSGAKASNTVAQPRERGGSGAPELRSPGSGEGDSASDDEADASLSSADAARARAAAAR